MTSREIWQMLLAGEQPPVTPQWLMGFSNTALLKKLVGESFYYEGCGEYPECGKYPLVSLGEENLEKERTFNRHIDRCVFPVGWGASNTFGHGGPGEFNKRVIESRPDRNILEYETNVKKRCGKTHTIFTPLITRSKSRWI